MSLPCVVCCSRSSLLVSRTGPAVCPTGHWGLGSYRETRRGSLRNVLRNGDIDTYDALCCVLSERCVQGVVLWQQTRVNLSLRERQLAEE